MEQVLSRIAALAGGAVALLALAAAFATGSAQFGGAPAAQAPAAMPRTGTGGPLQADTAIDVRIAAAALVAVAGLLLVGAPVRAAARRRHGR